MIGNNFTYGGLAISTKTAEFTVWLTEGTNWKELASSDEKIDRQYAHGAILSPTYLRSRIITLEGIVDGTSRANISKWMDYLENIFKVQTVFSGGVELKKFTLTDEQGRSWDTWAKLKTPIVYQTGDDDYIGTFRNWRVVLECPDPRIFSSNIINVTGIETNYWGWKLGVKLGQTKMNESINEINCTTAGDYPTPCIFTITALWDLNTRLKITNLDTGVFFGLEQSFIAGDVIIIDSKNYTVTRNGVNIKSTRTPWSKWVEIFGTMRLGVYDTDGALSNNELIVNIDFYDVKI